MRRVRSPTPRSGLAGSTSSESTSRSPSFMSPSGSTESRLASRTQRCGSRARSGGASDRPAASAPISGSARQLIVQRPHRLLLEDRDDAFEPGVLVGVEVDGVAARRERRSICSGSRFLRMFSTTASMMSRAGRGGATPPARDTDMGSPGGRENIGLYVST